MCFVDDKHERLVGVALKPGPRGIEDWSFQRTHQHVLEHRIVGHKHIRRRCQNFVTGEEFCVVRLHDSSNKLTIALPMAATATKPTPKVCLGWPLPTIFQVIDQTLRIRCCLVSTIGTLK
jgi:hypothetical protein